MQPDRKKAAGRPLGWGGPEGESGQVLVFSALVAGVMILVLLLLFNTGQLVSTKMQLQNTADAAAYSLASSEARSQNFIAYTNRAMVVNQVVVAQLASLVAWARMADQVATNLPAQAAWFTSAASGASDLQNLLADHPVEGLAESGVSAQAAWIVDGLATAQLLAQQAYQENASSALQAVISANDPAARLSTLVGDEFLTEHATAGDSFLQYHADPAVSATAFSEFAQVVNDSRDQFTAGRSATWLSGTFRSGTALTRREVQTRGGVELSTGDYATWTALDTTAVHSTTLGAGGDASEDSLGYGVARAGEPQGFDSTSGEWGGSWQDNPVTTATAAAADSATPELAAYSGLAPFHDLAAAGDTTGPAVVVVLEKPYSAIRTSSVVGIGGGELDLEGETTPLANAAVTVYAKAETYFKRASGAMDREDGKQEYSNLYNPYWQARLTALTTGEQEAIMGVLAP